MTALLAEDQLDPTKGHSRVRSAQDLTELSREAGGRPGQPHRLVSLHGGGVHEPSPDRAVRARFGKGHQEEGLRRLGQTGHSLEQMGQSVTEEFEGTLATVGNRGNSALA